MKRLEQAWNKIRASLVISWHTLFYYHREVKDQWILLDSQNGKDLGSNLFSIAQELATNPQYQDYRIFVSIQKEKKRQIKVMLGQYGMKKTSVICQGGFRYARVITSAKFLFTDTTFPAWFTRKREQVITNTWHGTPLKMMGKDVKSRAFDMGNVQRNFLMADYLIYPSDYMKEVMTSAYFLDKLYQGNILCSGYPRNSVFFDETRRKELQKELKLEGQRIYGYMPTWRGKLKQIDSERNTDQLEYFFAYLDRKLREDEVFFVQIHPFISDKIDYSRYRHIRQFPEGYEPYDILNICDCLVTDYSSVMFDYANTGRKIILFIYDYEWYMKDRGVYLSIEDFPFPKVRSVKQLLVELRLPREYEDEAFRERFCQYDGKNVSGRLCRHIIQGEKEFEELCLPGSEKENILIYGGEIAKNGITTALLNILKNVDTKERNYFITFRSVLLKKEPERIFQFPESVGFVPIPNVNQPSMGEKKALEKYYKKNKATPSIMKKVDRFYQRLYERNFGHCKYDVVIQFWGYHKEVIQLFLHAPSKRVIFVHNDMISELKTKGNQHELTLRRAYREYDKVVPVTWDIYEFTRMLGGREDNLQVVNNCHDYRGVLEKAEKEITFEKNTQSTVPLEKLKEILDSGARKFITIGRFSREKGHDMLIKAFTRYYKKHPDSYLIIIGGYGKLYEETLALAASQPSADHIIIIQSIANPMPILKKCDLFVLSSRYEALALVMLEADTLGVPVVATDIPGPRGFLMEHGGTLVPMSVKGIYQGMIDFDDGKIKRMQVDYEAYNQQAIRQFESLLEREA